MDGRGAHGAGGPEADRRCRASRISSLTTNVGNYASLALAAGVGAAFALAVGLALMRLSGLAAGIATFAVLEITNNVLTYEQSIGPA